MGIKFTQSAARHGISQRDAVYVMTHSIHQEIFTDATGKQARLFVGPVHSQTDRLAEVIAKIDGQDIIVFHAMETGERLT